MQRSIKDQITMLWDSLMHGLKGGDLMITQQASLGSNSEIVKENVGGTVWDDLVAGKETQQVKEFRDRYYRILKEADKYKVSVEGMARETGDYELDSSSSGNDAGLSASANKKSLSDYAIKIPLYNPEKYEIRVIQENKKIPKYSSFGVDTDMLKLPDSELEETTIDITRKGFTPRFKIEKYAKKIVIRKSNKKATDCLFDLYVSSMAGQFSKIEALFIAEMTKLMNGDYHNSDTVDYDTVKFYTSKASLCEDLCYFELNNIEFKEINVFDGNFVLTFHANIVSDGIDMIQKHRMKEVDEKYLDGAPNKDSVDINAALRRIEKDNKEEAQIEDFKPKSIKIN